MKKSILIRKIKFNLDLYIKVLENTEKNNYDEAYELMHEIDNNRFSIKAGLCNVKED